MTRLLFVILFTGLYDVCQCQVTPETTNLPPEERGLIISSLSKNELKYSALIRHLPIYPGYESFKGVIPGIKFTSYGNTHVMSADVDFRTKTFYMYDYFQRSILIGTGYNKDLNVAEMDIDGMHIGVSKGTVQLAVDWLSHTVYWTDSVFRWIVAASGHREKWNKDYYKIVINNHLDAPDGIALDPIKGYMFWSDNGNHPKIERSDMTGNDRHTIVTQHLVSPLSMEADHAGRRIYWIDSYTDAVLSCTYDGKDIKMTVRIPASTLFDLAIYKDVVYISDIRNDNLYTLNKTTGQQKSSSLKLSKETMYGIAVYGEETQPLKEKDYCYEADCEHICFSKENGSKCVCSEGYRFDQTTGHCQESFSAFHRAIVIANSTHVCMLDIRSLANTHYPVVCKFTVLPPSSVPTTAPNSASGTPQAPPGQSITIIEIDVIDRVLFFATEDSTIYKRPIDLPIEDNAKEIVVRAAGKISGLAYDTSYSKNLYWCESDNGNIWMVNVDTEISRRIIPETDIERPNSIAVLPKPRKLALVSGSPWNVSIQTMDLDGNNLNTVVSGYTDVVSLAFDNEAQVMYFASLTSSSIYRVTLDGATTTFVQENTIRNHFDLFQYNNYLAWIYGGQKYNIMKTKDLVMNITVAHGELLHNSTVIGMKVLDSKPRLPEAASPCAYGNGHCSQICITKYTGDIMAKVCECRLGYKLGLDKVSCKSEVVKDNFILVSDWTNNVMQQVDLTTHAINAVFNRENDIYIGVYFDTKTKRIIWSEHEKSWIYSSNLDGTDQQTIGNIGNSYPHRIDKDLTTGNVYYTSYKNPHIGVLTRFGENIWLKKDFTSEQLGDITVHPAKGWMFYTVVSTRSYVARANMDGTDEVIIITGANVTKPDGLAIDFTRDHLYWSDAAWDTIQRCDLEGKDCITIINKTGTFQPEEIMDLVTDATYLYYSAYRKDHIVRVTLSSPNESIAIGLNPSLGKLDTMALYTSSNKNVQPISDFCKAQNGLGDCSSICFPTKTGRTCACEADVPLKPDGKTCTNIYQCSNIIQQEVKTKTSREKIDIVIDRNCHRHLNDKCTFLCPSNYAPVIKGNSRLTCTNVGWTNETGTLCKELVCLDSSLSNGQILGKCSHRMGDVCMFKCDSGYKNTTDMISCNNNLAWLPTDSCIATVVSVTEAQKGLPVAGVATGIVLLVLVIIVLVGVIVFLILRRRGRKSSASKYANASFHHGQDGSIAIENPGYIPSETSTNVDNDEHPYSSVDTGRVQEVFGKGSMTAGQESLPEVASLEVTQDTSVLTHDSWLKEARKGASDKY